MKEILEKVRKGYILHVNEITCLTPRINVGLCSIAKDVLSTQEEILFSAYLIKHNSKKILGITYSEPDLHTFIWSPLNVADRIKWLDRHIMKNSEL